jgi:hypothetical protein
MMRPHRTPPFREGDVFVFGTGGYPGSLAYRLSPMAYRLNPLRYAIRNLQLRDSAGL